MLTESELREQLQQLVDDITRNVDRLRGLRHEAIARANDETKDTVHYQQLLGDYRELRARIQAYDSILHRLESILA